jgi:hypothetical protein
VGVFGRPGDRMTWGSIPLTLTSEFVMKRSFSFSWQLLFRTDDALFDTLSSSPIANLEEPPTYFNRISAKDPNLYHPIDVAFTNLFHERIRGWLYEHLNRPVQAKKFPYKLFLNSFGQDCRIGVILQIFMPNMISVRLICYDAFVLADEAAFRMRSFDNHPVLALIAQRCVEIVGNAVCPGRIFRRIDVKPIIKVNYDVSDSSFLGVDEVFLPAFLINDKDYSKTHKSVFDKVVQANKEHNRKGELSKLILINKQGYLAATNAESVASPPVAQEIKKRGHMFELGCVLRQFFRDYPTARQKDMWEKDYLFFATRRYIQQPALTFESSFGNTLAWQVIMDSFKLKEAFDHAGRMDEEAIRTLTNFFDRHPNPHYSDRAFWQEVRTLAN